jgi:GntR family transcriptional regulator
VAGFVFFTLPSTVEVDACPHSFPAHGIEILKLLTTSQAPLCWKSYLQWYRQLDNQAIGQDMVLTKDSGIDLIKGGPLPRYHQLKELLREQIRDGAWVPGSLIPSERALSEQYGISRMTARQAVTELVNEGLLYREQGRGTYVGRPKISQQLLRLTGFTDDMKERGQRPGTRVLDAAMWPADDVTAKQLRIRTGQHVFRLRRLRLADAEPLAVETSCISFLGCERLLKHDFSAESLYQALEFAYDVPPLEAEQELEAGLAEEVDARLLGVSPGSPVLCTRRVAFTRRGIPIEYASSFYRGDKYRFYTRMVRESI